MSPQRVEYLWLQRAAGDVPTDNEQAELIRTLDEQPGWRDVLLDDLATDGLLQGVARSDRTEAAFVAEFLRRAEGIKPGAGLEEDFEPIREPSADRLLHSADDLVFVEPVFAAPPVTQPPMLPPFVDDMDEMAGIEPLASFEHIVAGPAATLARPAAKPVPWRLAAVLSLACSVALLSAISYLLFWRNGASDRSAENQHAAVEHRAINEGVPQLAVPAVHPHEQQTVEVIPPAQDPRPSYHPDELRVPLPSKVKSPLPIQMAVWKSGGPVGDVLPAGRHELSQGNALVTINSGGRMELCGPAVVEVGNDNKIVLSEGKLRALDWAPTAGFTIATPTSQVIDPHGDIDLAVDGSGATDVTVRSGEAQFEDWTGSDKPGHPLRLSTDEFNQAHVFRRAGVSAAAPIACQITGPGNRFLGRITAGGQSLAFGSAQAFADCRQQATERFTQAPDDFLRNWSEMVRSMGLGDGMNASININGQLVETQTIDGLFKALQQQATQPDMPGGHATGSSSFEGSININGKETRFHSREEFEAARKQLLGPWQSFQHGK